MTDQSTFEANQRIGRRVLLELWGQGRLEVSDELYSPDYVDHVAHGPEPAEVHRPDGLQAAVTMFRTAFPDLEYFVDDELAERDLVVSRFSARGTHLGPFLGAAPTGKPIRYTGTDINRVHDGGSSNPGCTTTRWGCSNSSASRPSCRARDRTAPRRLNGSPIR